MAKKEKSSFTRYLTTFMLLIPNFLRLFNDLTRLISYEARLASKSAVEIIMLAVMLGILVSSTWIGCLIFFYSYLVSLGLSPFAAFGSVLGINLLLILIICLTIKRLKRNLLFLATRHQLHLEDHRHEEC